MENHNYNHNHNHNRHPPTNFPSQQLDPNLLLLLQNQVLCNPNNVNQNSNFPFQFHNPNFMNNQNSSFPLDHNHNHNHNPNNLSHQFNSSTSKQQRRETDSITMSTNPKFPLSHKNNEDASILNKIEAAVTSFRRQAIQAGEHVSVSKLSQSVLLNLQAPSWDSLGFQLHQVPSLHQLILVESKVNAFIRCHVAVHKITTLYDLQEALCLNEGVDKFEDLELGPFLRHPLVKHFFSLSKDVEEVYKITSQDVVSLLSLFLYRNRNVVIDEFLNFVAKKHKLTNPALLGLRIQSLGMHIGFLHKARNAQDVVLKKALEVAEVKSVKRRRKKRPLFSLQKQELDERFSAISERVTSFASVQNEFRGKHIRFVSSSSDEVEGMSDSSNGEEIENGSLTRNHGQPSSVEGKNGDRVSSCPYPSVAEELTRLGLKGENGEYSFPCSKSVKNKQKKGQRKKKRKLKSLLSGSTDSEEENKMDSSDANDSIRMFITTWKEACREHPATEVLDKMLRFYKLKSGIIKRIRNAFSVFPLGGLLNVAVTSIKRGMWDSMYDTLQFMGELGQDTEANKLLEFENIDVEPIETGPKCTSKSAPCINLEDIVRHASDYLAQYSLLSGGSQLVDRALMFSRALSLCEGWLAEQFSVNDFKLLGHGDFYSFLERNTCVLPKKLVNFVTEEVQERQSFEVSMVQRQLVMLLCQASSSLWEEGVVTKDKIMELLASQFPLLCFKITESGSTQEVLDFVRKQESGAASNCVIFSAALLGTSKYDGSGGSTVSDMLDDSGPKQGLESITSRDAINNLLKAPFLSDLNSWSHWDHLYGPSLGSLLEWLLTEINVEDLLCLVTKDGKIIRVNHSASVDLFFQALLEESPFQVAVQLLSLLVVSGGKRHSPLSLLKCQARQAFEVIMGKYIQNMDSSAGKKSEKRPGGNKSVGYHSSTNLVRNLSRENNAIALVSRIVIDCLVFLPSEFRCFAADVLLAGLQSLVKDIASTFLVHCKGNEERLMLHEIGYSLGIIEWVHDHNSVCPITDSNSLISTGAQSLTCMGSNIKGFEASQCPSIEIRSTVNGSDLYRNDTGTSISTGVSEVEHSEFGSHRHVEEDIKEAALIIESIRRDEFGLDLNTSDTESSLLKKQHARLGRALHCLSEELYSQDSHFLLELVQNADDNVYSTNVEPTLSFVLFDTGITVLNNERGFTATNIRALCDIGNSTKKGSSAGYIGQKGIGFKSVFRVTDAPEIHSNGFHIKFDIGQGQIGFVLPTLIPPFDVEMLKTLLPGDELNSWNTCIVLPFKSKLLEGSAINNILSMFSDLHPSLLLFLHRLRCIKLRNMLDDSLIVMRKEVVGDGIVKVSHGEEQMTWFVSSNKLHPKVIRPNVHMTEISIALTLNESLNGDYEPILIPQPVFAFLPLRTYGLKFILQADFVLPSSREEVDGDSPWNQWLLSEFPALFVSAEKLFCSLPCFRGNPARAVSAYMSFVPLMGEVYGFFSGLPRMIIAKLRQSNCLLQDGCEEKWVPPCKVLRGWNDKARMLLSDTLLYEHLGLTLLHKDVNLSDPLARALGIEDYGPKILVQFISSLGRTKDGIKSMGLCWLFSWLNELLNMFNSYAPICRNSGLELDLINSLKKVPFIPLSDGTYGSLDEGTIWFHADSISTGFDGELGNETFPCLFATLRIVNPALFSKASADVTLANNCTRVLQKIGVQQISAHELVRTHILPSISDDRLADKSKHLVREYITFIMLHLHSGCVECHVESEHIISELCNKALILTNHGYKRPVEVPIHFSKEFGNSFDASKLMSGLEYKWHEVDAMYLKHPTIEALSCGLTKWREFLSKLGVTDFVKVFPVEKPVADLSPTLRNEIMCDRNLISPGLVVKDWESPELGHILSLLSQDGSQERCKYFLQVLDTLWDDHFSDKVSGCCSHDTGLNNLCFKSSFWHCISNIRWVISSVDNDLHYPRELFYDCDAVRSILGSHAPYAVPKVRSVKLLTEIGFKTQVTVEDALRMLQSWRTMEGCFTASLSQMSTFYSFIWKEMTTCRQQVLDAFHAGPSIFIPSASMKTFDDVVSGVFLSPEEVYWHDSTGALDHKRNVEFPLETNSTRLSKTLSSIYPGLHDFFVNDCGVLEAPSFRHYCHILQLLSGNSSALQAANAVFQIFLKLSDGLKCGLLGSDDVAYLKDCLLQSEFTVLPALQDKWVSLHPSFGLVCWSDDDILKKQFKYSDNIEFLYFGELNDNGKEMLQTNVSLLLQNLGIPAISKVVSREAIYYGSADSGFKTSVVAWVLPYAQRYLYNLHPERYGQLKQSGCELHNLKIFVVEKLFYRNVIKRCNCSSKKRTECNSLLQGNILYTTRESDSHSMFMELSRLFFDGAPELHLANYLHMITTMAESGSTEDQIEFFILNSQKMERLPKEEPLWCLSTLPENDEQTRNAVATNNSNEHKSKKKAVQAWPPVDWKTAPGFGYAREHGLWKPPVDVDVDMDESGNRSTRVEGHLLEGEIEDDVIEDDGVVEADIAATIPNFKNEIDDSLVPLDQVLANATNVVVDCVSPEEGRSKSKSTSTTTTPGAEEAMRAGRLGELLAFRYFSGKEQASQVKWVNQDEETGLPYDILIGDEHNRQFIEVKASRYAKKDWFSISTREWQFAAEKGDSFSIAHVLLSAHKLAKIIVYKNPVKLCQLGKLQLTVMFPRT